MDKIIIIGSPGAGKTTLATKLGAKLGIEVHYLDKYFWQENWQPLPQDQFKEVQSRLMQGKRWIIDGNFTKSIGHRMTQADTIIFLDFPKHIILWRYFKRYFQHFNKVRFDVGGNNKQNMKWKHLKFVLLYPASEVYALLKEYGLGKNIIILHRPKGVNQFLHNI